ncbi:hypothetical protein C8J55DRAFT_564426 [Lentinula edodes]|uniref:Protein kinase domain-containing protein n=1 Tax=Lentinula lateritia TaxID=40482 RepID=A0A9W8ZY41_9AGAR|nr:hypothetical protein C8J55DRAFT_564426 [Lentinula edodes]
MRGLKGVFFVFSLLLLVFTITTSHAAPAITQNSKDADMRIIVLGPLGKLRNPDWILGFYGDNDNLNQDDKTVFEKELEVEVSRRINFIGRYNQGIYSVWGDYKVEGTEYNKRTAIIKGAAEIDGRSWGEVKALKDVGLYINSGLANIHLAKKDPVVVMKIVKGLSIKDTEEYRNANAAQQLKLFDQVKPLVEKEVVRFAVQKGILHVDFHSSNFLVGVMETDNLAAPMTVHLVDWGFPSVFRVKQDVTEAEVKSWFELQWNEIRSRQDKRTT